MSSFSNMAADNNSEENLQESAANKPPQRSEPLVTRTHGIANYVQYAVWMWRNLPMPVIAAVHGVAYGSGFQIALRADIRYAAPEPRFSIMEIKWGIVPDMAGTQLMRHLAREDIVSELAYTGRIFTAQQALEYGFITRISENPLAATFETAKEIATKTPMQFGVINGYLVPQIIYR
ncbi:MAG: enoyl-CoA hydratase/isomerase family protein [Pseudomonadales bacterium]|nr:enoyl-CoA hydratase/isomerase family protein [Pseudomonadales bacterium]